MPDKPTFYVTSPIYYVNDAPHIGHAYTSLACDVMARFKRLDGYDVRFLTGTDEHGQKVEKAAVAKGVDPQAFTDRVSGNFRDLTKTLKLSNDDFIRTTEPRHVEAVQALWQKLVESGDIYLDTYGGWYAVRDEAFYGENELTKLEDGRRIAPSGAEVEWVEEPSYFFRLSGWQDRLIEFYRAHPGFIAPESRRNEVIRFVEGGLQDLSISRTTFNWGIQVPGDEAHVVYVWLDALTNYITAVGYPGQTDALWRFWPADLHMVGKDILRFHAVYWPAFLMAAGLEPPKRVFAHGWWTNEGQKISKSLGNVIDPLQLIETYGLDQTRYFLMREVPFGNDGDFAHRAMVARMNNELANDYGNLAQRVLSMIGRYCGGEVPQTGELQPEDQALLDQAIELLEKLRRLIDRQAFHEALEAIWAVIRAANVYVDRQAPWTLRKADMARTGAVLYVMAETIRRVALMTQPFMPDSSAKILDQLNIPEDARSFAFLDRTHSLVPGEKLPKPQGVFPRYTEDTEAE